MKLQDEREKNEEQIYYYNERMILKAIKSWVYPFIVWNCKYISLNEMKRI